MKKERLFYLDFIRAIAILMIVIAHFDSYLIDYSISKYIILFFYNDNWFIGKTGVSLFLIISGAALMYTYDGNFHLIDYFKKRFMSIYPMFWIAYIATFLYYFYVNKSYVFTIPKIRFLLTIIGIDGYTSWKISNFYILGEWFLGFIIILYLCFPILIKAINKFPKALLIVTIIAYVITLQTYNSEMKIDLNLFARLTEFLFGMYFIKYIKKVKFPMFIVSFIASIILFFIKIDLQQMYLTTISGIFLFIVFVYIAQNIKSNRFKNPWETISKYSYAIFLIQHVVIIQVLSKFTTLSRIESYCSFAIICIAITLVSYELYKLNNVVIKSVKNIFINQT